MIFAPPQHGKSELVSVRLPAFFLGKRPDDPVILASYSASLAEDKSRQVRQIVESPDFKTLFPNVITASDSRAVDHWHLEGHRGGLLAAGIGGPVTGRGAVLGIIDDPVKNWEEACSETLRKTCWEWYRTTFRTRIWENGSIILIMTRWHQEDLAGRLLNEQGEKWTVLRFPAIAERQDERNRNDKRLGLPIDQQDPLDRKGGEPLCPKRYSLPALESIRYDVGSIAWDFEYQGVPFSIAGGRFHAEWFGIARDDHDVWVLSDQPGQRRLSHPDRVKKHSMPVIIIIDPANRKTKLSKYTEITAFGVGDGQKVIVLAEIHKQLAVGEIIPALDEMCARWLPDWVGIEANGFQMMLVDEARKTRLYPHIPTVHELDPEGKSKLTRATPAIIRAEQGRIFVNESMPTLEEWVAELCLFTGNEKEDVYVDRVDTLAYAVLGIDRHGMCLADDMPAEPLAEGKLRW